MGAENAASGDAVLSKRSLFVMFCTAVLLCYLIFVGGKNHAEMVKNVYPKHSFLLALNSNFSSDQNPKIILDWTGFFSESMVSMWNLFRKDCPNFNTSCTFTTDRSSVENAAAVIFHVRQPGWNLNDVPDVRKLGQRYVMFLRESPPNTHMDFTKAGGVFNWTMTHRTDSDVWWPGGKILKLRDREEPEFSLEEMESVVGNKTKLVAWWASNCHTDSKREEYVKELQKHIPVDVFGSCGTFKCARDNNDCREMLKRDYFFYLSFENSVCTDYITEKFYERIQDFVVPIVLRAKDYQLTSPDGTPRAINGSFIAADNFKSAKELAEFLKKLSKDKKKYLEYHKWRLKWKSYEYSAQSYSDPPLCKLCEMVHSDLAVNVIDDLQGWWYDGACVSDFAKRIL